MVASLNVVKELGYGALHTSELCMLDGGPPASAACTHLQAIAP